MHQQMGVEQLALVASADGCPTAPVMHYLQDAGHQAVLAVPTIIRGQPHIPRVMNFVCVLLPRIYSQNIHVGDEIVQHGKTTPRENSSSRETGNMDLSDLNLCVTVPFES